MNGFFQLQRRFFNHELWTEEREFSRAEAFLDLLQLAAFTHTRRIVKGAVIELKPGQLCGSIRYLADRWKWSIKRVRTYLDLLEAERMLAREKAHTGTVLTLVNYGKYAQPAPPGGTPKAQAGHTGGTPGAQIEEGKEPSLERSSKGRDAIPTLEAVKSYAASAPLPISVECAIAYHDTQERDGWLNNKGHPIADWRAGLRLYASRWNENLKSNGRGGRNSPPPRQRPGSNLGDDTNIEGL